MTSLKDLILIVDDHPLMVVAMQLAVGPLFENPEFQTASTIAEASALVMTMTPRLILLDLSLPDANGLDGVFRLRSAWPKTTLVVISGRDDQMTVALARSLGIDGFISKSQALPDIQRLVRSILAGHPVFPSYAEPGAAASAIAALTPTQGRVLAAVATGKLNKQIAFEFGVSEATIKSHLFATFKKIGVSNRTQASLLFSHLIEP
jgi:DNA-binding NarL/FixJ family response regulator